MLGYAPFPWQACFHAGVYLLLGVAHADNVLVAVLYVTLAGLTLYGVWKRK
jgi:hypothetical protein